MINPINHTRTPEGVDRYQGEPYVVAADVYAHPMHVGRVGWTWYTGSAGWMYRTAIEGILGLRRQGATFSITPTIPAIWPEFTIVWNVSGTRFEIHVLNPQHRPNGVASATFDDAAADPRALPLRQDGQTHRIVVTMGDDGRAPSNRM
jgi:cyclic beta-1,2-glucan synthetase